MKFNRLSDRKLKVRNQLICYAWEQYKNELTMKELADCFRLDLSRVWVILRGGSDKEKIAIGKNYLNKK